MVPAASNREVAKSTMDELLHFVPKSFGVRAFFSRAAICIIDERVRIAMMFESSFR
jgi:hypothetical protein